MIMKKLLGTTIDNVQRNVDVYADDEYAYCVYEDGYETFALLDDIKSEPDRYMFTPYVEFVELFEKH